MSCKLHLHVPKDPLENVRFRQALMKACADDSEAQRMAGCTAAELRESVKLACQQDLLFFVNAFCWTVDPRVLDGTSILPFSTYPFQDSTLLKLEKNLGRKHITIMKSRDMGATWMVLAVFVWAWMHRSYAAFLVSSRKEDLVDSSDNPDCLFWKMDTILENLPVWLCPKYDRKKLNITNLENHSTIDGESANPNMARGGRRTAIFRDEDAFIPQSYDVDRACKHATNCIVMVSTPDGKNNSFYDNHTNPALEHLELLWTLHPRKVDGLYRDEKGKMRSPWYNEMEKIIGNRVLMAQEVDCSFEESDSRFFHETLVDRLLLENVKPHTTKGWVKYDRDSNRLVFVTDVEGPLKLWINPTISRECPRNIRAVIGCDIASGAGGQSTSNSVAAIYNESTSEKIGEYVTGLLPPHDFAREVFNLVHWFAGYQGPAFLIWESNGPGGVFGRHFLNMGYRNVYYKTNESSVTKRFQGSDLPGWHSDRQSKPTLLGEYRMALAEGLVFNRSRLAIEELRDYVNVVGGQVEHQFSLRGLDASQLGPNHGDRVIADALSWFAMSKRNDYVKIDKPQLYIKKDLVNTALGRREKRERDMKRDKLW